jgi:hypothetical protein
MGMLPFWLSIAALSLVQGALVALAGRLEHGWLARLRTRGWAAVLPASVLGFVLIARQAEKASAQGLTYLALIAVPLLAALALGLLMRGARLRLVLLAPALFAVAWADRGGLTGNAAALALSGLSCVGLGVLIAAVTPPKWLSAGIVTMALADSALVISDLLQSPNNALNAAHPAANLPQLQSAVFGSAVMGYGDLFIAGVLGGLIAANGRSQTSAALLTAGIALAMDFLFFFVDELPATVPVALALLILELRRRRRSAADRAPLSLEQPAPARAPAHPGRRSPAR